jgi:pimeloyl-ACP methyl ester carboxylesterase
MQLDHAGIALWLSQLHAGDGPNLLLLHALGGSSADFPAGAIDWPGPVHALDFCGHGRSGRVVGGGYYPELLAADADAALAQLGPAYVLGAGLGAYVALLLAGARPELVPGVALIDGPGLAAHAEPDFSVRHTSPSYQPNDVSRALQSEARTDPAALTGLDPDVRPPDYAAQLAANAKRVVLLDDGGEKPPWWRAVAALPNAVAVQGGQPAALAALRVVAR